jgi:cold shock CspA family protein
MALGTGKTGTIKTILIEKGFGFITLDGTQAGAKNDLFFHYTGLIGKGHHSDSLKIEDLKVGNRVKFDIVEGKKGEMATNVELYIGTDVDAD